MEIRSFVWSKIRPKNINKTRMEYGQEYQKKAQKSANDVAVPDWSADMSQPSPQEVVVLIMPMPFVRIAKVTESNPGKFPIFFERNWLSNLEL